MVANLPTLDDLVLDLLRDKHGPNVPVDDMEAMKKALLPKLNEYITLRVMTELSKKSQDTLKEFQNWITDKKPSQEEVQKYISDKIPDGTSFLTQVLMDFRNTYLGPQGA